MSARKTATIASALTRRRAMAGGAVALFVRRRSSSAPALLKAPQSISE